MAGFLRRSASRVGPLLVLRWMPEPFFVDSFAPRKSRGGLYAGGPARKDFRDVTHVPLRGRFLQHFRGVTGGDRGLPEEGERG